MTHIMTVTSTDGDAPEYEISGSHDVHCEVWQECFKDWHRHPNFYLGNVDSDWGTKRAGLHQFIDGVWMVPDPGNCGLHLAFGDADWADVLREAGVGTHEVSIDWDGWWSFSLHRTGEVAAA